MYSLRAIAGTFGQETMQLGEIRQIEEVRGHALRNVLLGVGIGVGVCTGIVLIKLSKRLTN